MGKGKNKNKKAIIATNNIKKNSNSDNKEKNNNKKKNRNNNNNINRNTTNNRNTSIINATNNTTRTDDGSSKLSSLQLSYKKKLDGAKFRILNERLYTINSKAALQEFQQNPNNFTIYHEGFRQQVLSWPINPIDNIINYINNNYNNNITIVDMGCGDAKLAEILSNKYTIYSYDLISNNSLVTACDISNVPNKSNSVDIVVYCLSLMNNNINNFIQEAYRILKTNGSIIIIEVRSRFESNSNSNSNNNSISNFKKYLYQAGFNVNKNSNILDNNSNSNSGNNKGQTNKMFFEIVATKSNRPCNITTNYELKPCIYKRR